MAINQDIADRYISHRAFLLSEEQRIAREILEIMLRGEEQAIGGIVSAYEKALAAAEARGELLLFWDDHGVRFRRRALSRARAALVETFPAAKSSLKTALLGVATDEKAMFVDTLEAALPKPALSDVNISSVPERQLAQLVDSRFGANLKGSAKLVFDDMQDIGERALSRLNHVIEDGVRDGVGTRRMVQIAKNVVGTEHALGRDVARYVRTAVQATANDVAGMTYRENRDIIRAEQYHATLDDDTCPICGPLDGKVYKIDKNGRSQIPRPPRHPDCRCFASPVVTDWKAMGLPDTLDKRAKALLDGKPADRTIWSDWVTRNDARLKESLGPARAELIDSGKVKLSDLASTTEVFNLDVLRKKAS